MVRPPLSSLVWLVPLLWLAAPLPVQGEGAVTVYAGRLTTNGWEDFFVNPEEIHYRDSFLLAVAPSSVLATPLPGLTLEAEGQVVRHFGRQAHWEVNTALVGRWHNFPWDDHVRSTAAFGVGPSWAGERPDEEKAIDSGETRRLLAYWVMEVTAAPAKWTNWAASLRLHHRSTAYGLLADEGGANVLALGVRRRF